MSNDLETLLRRELDSVAAQVSPRPGWASQVRAGLEARRTPAWHRPAAALLAVAAVVTTVLVVSGHRDGRPEPAPEPVRDEARMVDIGERSLSLSCSGVSESGEPTVVLETALGGRSASYDAVKASVARDLRVCTYDRAGTGDSHAARDFPRTARSLADDLASLVEAADLGPSIVLVTDGFTGLSGAVFAGDHPGLVTGLVFLDPRGPHVSQAQAQALGPQTASEPEVVAQLRSAFATDSLSLNGEQVSWPASEAEAAALLDPPGPAFGEVPTIVLRPRLGRQVLPPLPPSTRSAWWDAVRADQDQLAAESTQGVLRVVPGVEGSLAASAADAVADAIREVTRASGRRSPGR